MLVRRPAFERLAEAIAASHAAERGHGPGQAGRVAHQADLRPTSGRGRLFGAARSGDGAAGSGAGIVAASANRAGQEPGRRRPARIAPAARAPNTSPSSSELLASRLAPWTPVHATSPAANSPRHGRAAPQVGLDAAHDVVRRRPTGIRSRARSSPPPRQAVDARSGSARARSRHRGAASDRYTGWPVRRRSRTIARATRSRGARSPAGS